MDSMLALSLQKKKSGPARQVLGRAQSSDAPGTNTRIAVQTASPGQTALERVVVGGTMAWTAVRARGPTSQMCNVQHGIAEISGRRPGIFRIT